jgi:hypothetical protein
MRVPRASRAAFIEERDENITTGMKPDQVARAIELAIAAPAAMAGPSPERVPRP